MLSGEAVSKRPGLRSAAVLPGETAAMMMAAAVENFMMQDEVTTEDEEIDWGIVALFSYDEIDESFVL